MILHDTEIEALSGGMDPLIAGFDRGLLSGCTYTFRIGTMFRPPAEGAAEPEPSTDLVALEPNETVLLMTRERIQLPADVLATYSPLNSLARLGLMLLNASVVEPGYQGNLSCVLVNLSSQKVTLRSGQRVAKAVFYRLRQAPAEAKPLRIDEAKYRDELQDIATTKYHRSFLNVNSVVARATAAATQSARKGVITGGVIVFVLVAFAQFEPLFSKWLREKTGLASASTQLDLQKRELDLQRRELELQRREFEAQRQKLELERQLAELKAQLEAAQSRSGSPRR